MRWPPTSATSAALVLALAGCGSDLAPEDVPRFDARDAVIEETHDAPVTDVSARFDVIPSIDVTPLGDVATTADAAAPGDLGGPCQAVSEDYAAAVRYAQTCSVEGECSTRVCETLCCACEVFINAGTAEYERLRLLRERWQTLGCGTMARCAGGGGGGGCGAAVAASCSAEGRCVTVRDRLDAGGLDDAATYPDAAVAAMDGATR